MEERTVADYFVVAGLPSNPEPVDEDYCEGLNPNLKNIEPITDITVIFPSFGEEVPRGFSCVEKTPSGYPANLNSGSIRSPEVYLCYRRGRDKPPLVDIGVMYDGKERLLPDAEVVISTPGGRPANVNNTNARILLTYRRAPETMPCNELVVTDICVIITNKGERPPHAFCLINKNLNKGTIMGCDVYLCYKKSMNRPPLIQYKADVLLRYPPIDRRGFPFPSSVAMFCLPMCATVECWPTSASQPRPVFSTFVLTVSDATEKLYGAGVTFYEEFDETKLIEEQRVALGIALPGEKNDKSVHVNKSIVILSHFPFFDTFRTFLFFLVKMVSQEISHEIPIERYISHLLNEVPFPSPQRPHILLQLSAVQSVLISHPHDSPLPKSGASFRSLLTNLGPDNCLLILLLMLTEQKLLIHSLRPDVLTAVTEAVSVLTFPFHWQCPYIPLCPLGLCAMFQAPVPFLIGVDSRFFDLYEPPCDVTCVDLDTMSITICEDRKYLNTKLLPKKPTRILKHALESLQDKIYQLGRVKGNRNRDLIDNSTDIDFQLKKRERMLDLEIQETFLRFMTGVLKGYRNFLLPITKAPTIGATDASSLFDFHGFLRSRDKTYHKFYSLVLKTQMFARFIEERSFVSDIDTGLAFFDECVDKVEADDNEFLKLIDTHEANVNERTVFVMPPEPPGVPGQTYQYNSKFILNEAHFDGVSSKKSNALIDRVLNQCQTDSYPTPGTPVARRSKQEIKSAKRNARKYVEQPRQWAKYLLSTCYSLWFIHLPSYVSVATSKHMALCLAYEMLVRMAKNRLQPIDEVCYRVVMQLCGLYSQPVVAVKVLFEMKRCGLTPNAITYGFYNKAVLEAQWPSNMSNSSQLMWNKLRNVILGVAQFRAAGKKNATDRRHSVCTGTASDLTEEADRISTGSGGSMDSKVVAPGGLLGFLSPSLAATTATAIPDELIPGSGAGARVSGSSDVGYASMHEQDSNKTSGGEDEVDSTINIENPSSSTSKFWGKMGQSFDSWVKSSVSTLATNVAAFATADPNAYYSPAGLIMSNYRGDYSATNNEGDEEIEEEDYYDEEHLVSQRSKRNPQRRLDFASLDESGSGTAGTGAVEENTDTTLRLLRSVSFGNDTEIMSKLKELKEELVKKAKLTRKSDPVSVPESAPTADTKRAGSEESENSLENKVNQFYEGTPNSQLSREITPVEAEEKAVTGTDDLTVPQTHSSEIQIPKSPSASLGNNLSSLNSPARTPVTQNDPLGALLVEGEITIIQNHHPKKKPPLLPTGHAQRLDSPKRTASDGNIGATALALTNQQNGTAGKLFHRSSTLPNYANACVGGSGSGGTTPNGNPSLTSCLGTGSGNTLNTSGLSAFSSSFKSFSRYSPGRLSLRKAGTQLLESTIGNKKAEAFMESFNQMKSAAAVTAKKKLDEFKEVINNTNSPNNRNGPFGRLLTDDIMNDDDGADLTDENAEPVDQWASVSESYLDQLLTTAEGITTTGAENDPNTTGIGAGNSEHDTPLSTSTQSLVTVETLIRNLTLIGATGTKRDLPSYPVAIEIHMTTCSICHSCSSLLYDEEIMAGWTADDSNLTTKCPHCRKLEVPFLEVVVKDFRHVPLSQTLFGVNAGSGLGAPSLENLNSQPAGASNCRRLSLNPSLLTTGGLNPSQNANNNRKYSLNPTSGTGGSETPSHFDNIPTVLNGGANKNDSETIQELNSSGVESVSKCVNGDSPTADPLGVLKTPMREENYPLPPEVTINDETEAEGASANDTTLKQQQPDFTHIEGVNSELIIVPYLSPLVLRKELENCLEHQGDSCLTQYQFVDEHPVIYWNLVWFYHRSNLTSHMKGLALHAGSTKPKEAEFKIDPSWAHADHRNVFIKCKWDNPKFHSNFSLPLYVQWLQIQNNKNNNSTNGGEMAAPNSPSNDMEKLLNEVIRSVNRGELSIICPKLLYHYHKQQQGKARHFPTYRDILFLYLMACGKEAMDLNGFSFDRDYRNAYDRLRNADEFETMDMGDTPPGDTAIFCRTFFRELQLI